MFSSQKREARSAQVDLCKLEELERLARKTEGLAMDIACQLHESTNGSGHPSPPKLAGEEVALAGSGHPDPPKLDAIVEIAAGAKAIRDGVNALR